MERDKGGIFSKAPGSKLLCLLKIKIKQNSGCPNKEQNAIFKRIHQNIRAYQKSVRKTVD